MAVQFTPKPGKPHIAVYKGNFSFYMWPREGNQWGLSDAAESVRAYCKRVNPAFYETQGEAARALHYGSEK